MTQQSQSPPNSQIPRSVNGPTSFKNLLPNSKTHQHQKQLQQQQNHFQTVTSPIVPYIHQNGGVDSSTSLLGKRKGGDIDENSNHNSRKMMKKSNFGAISSPLTFNANNSSSINSNIQYNNNNSNSNSHSLVPVPQSKQTQQQQLQQQLQVKLEEQPKKQRGRRKGSKGIDSQLNGIIPDFQAEIQQKIALSAGKRNKTTFELQQMLESHQNTSASWTNGDVLDSSSLDRG